MSGKSNRSRNFAILLAGLIVTCLGIFFVVQTTAGDDPAIHSPEQPTGVGLNLPLVQMNGVWTAEAGSSKFVATVKNQTITIELGNDDTAMTYWYGTFVDQEARGATITSDLIETNEVILSQARSKDFVLKGTLLEFEFKAMGMTKKVRLSRA